MNLKFLRSCAAGASCVFLAASFARAVQTPVNSQNPLIISAADPAGTTFQFTGTFNPTDTISFTADGGATLQKNSQYVTNAAGVVAVSGAVAGETVGSIADVPGMSIPYGALELQISGLGTAVLFPANSASGLGASAPSQHLLFTGDLASLFGNFKSVVNPTLTFIVADSPANYADNTSGYSLANFTVSPFDASVPIPAAGWQTLLGIAGVLMITTRKKIYGAFK
jgi:hypothetical protein